MDTLNGSVIMDETVQTGELRRSRRKKAGNKPASKSEKNDSTPLSVGVVDLFCKNDIAPSVNADNAKSDDCQGKKTPKREARPRKKSTPIENAQDTKKKKGTPRKDSEQVKPHDSPCDKERTTPKLEAVDKEVGLRVYLVFI